MYRQCFIGFLCILATASIAGQQSVQASPFPAPSLYYGNEGATEPELLSVDQSLLRSHCKRIHRLVVMGGVVDASGVPRQLKILLSTGSKLEQPASEGLNHAVLNYAGAERFKPGMRNGEPVAVAIELEVEVQACKQTSVGSDGRELEEIALGADPVQLLEEQPRPLADPKTAVRALSSQIPNSGTESANGPGVSPPKPVYTPEAIFSTLARKFKIQGICLVQLIVDSNGEPKDVHLLRSLEPSLDQQALKAVARYRFEPAMKAGRPVPVVITIEVNFRLY